MKNEEDSQGPDPEVQQLCEATLTKVIPRLLRPLETGGEFSLVLSMETSGMVMFRQMLRLIHP